MRIVKDGKTWSLVDNAWICWDVLLTKKEADNMRHFINFCGTNLAREIIVEIIREQDYVDSGLAN